MPRRQRKSREEERKFEPGGAQEKKKSCGAPLSEKSREEERKSESDGAWKKKKRSGAPPSEKKQGRREKIRARRGKGEEKEQ